MKRYIVCITNRASKAMSQSTNTTCKTKQYNCEKKVEKGKCLLQPTQLK